MRWTRRPAVLVILLAVLSVAPTPGILAAPGTAIAVLDNLGSAAPQMTFSVFGTGAKVVSSRYRVGPMFSLTDRTLLTEIGAFVNNCAKITAFVPDCPDTQPLTVEVRPARGGVPDPGRVIASFKLTHDNDPLVFSYESVNPALILEAGTYFALVGAQGDDVGQILTSASGGAYTPPASIPTGFLDTDTGVPTTELAPIAVRILGIVLVPDSSTTSTTSSTTSSTSSSTTTSTSSSTTTSTSSSTTTVAPTTTTPTPTTLPATAAICGTLERVAASFSFLSPLLMLLRTVLGC